MSELREETLRDILVSLRDVLAITRAVSREQFLRDEDRQFRVMQAIVKLGWGVQILPPGTLNYKLHGPWWRRLERLRYGLVNGHTRLDWTYLWETIPRDWPELEFEIVQILRELV